MIHTAGDDFMARLTAVQGHISPKLAQLAVFVSEHYVQAAFMSMRELAAASGVSLATMVGLPPALGYASLDAMRASIQDRINFDLTAIERLQASEDAAHAADIYLHSEGRPRAAMRRRLAWDEESLDVPAARQESGR